MNNSIDDKDDLSKLTLEELFALAKNIGDKYQTEDDRVLFEKERKKILEEFYEEFYEELKSLEEKQTE